MQRFRWSTSGLSIRSHTLSNNYLDENVKCKMYKFADNTKSASRVISLSQQQELQNVLNTLGEWAVDSQIFFLMLINVNCFILVIEMFRPTRR